MKSTTRTIIGYILLLFGPPFLVMPFLSLLAFPLLVIASVFFIQGIFSMKDKTPAQSNPLGNILMIMGSILLLIAISGTLILASLRVIDVSHGRIIPFGIWNYLVFFFALLAPTLLTYGLKLHNNFTIKELIYIWFFLFALPLWTLTMTFIYYGSGFPFGA
ncbi:MAG: hypothetical protein WC595_05515 [Candidatus Nanoarchaeia archaeon]